MYLVISSYVNGNVDYIGPFPSRDVALDYIKAIELEDRNHKSKRRPHVVDLIIPYRVKEIIWRES